MGTSQGVHTIQLPPNPYGGSESPSSPPGLDEWKRLPPPRCCTHCVDNRREPGVPEQEVHRDLRGRAPGIRELLPVLQSRDDVVLGLLTGNFEEAARIKLGHFDLWDYVRCGAFGDDAADRNKLVPFAVDRARTCGFGSFDYADVLVIGDTPHDVACAVAVGAQPVAVATGGFSVEQLRATGAPIVLEDLSDTVSFLALLESDAREPQRQEG